MRLFKKVQPVKAETTYQDCIDYLRELEQPDYTKILKVVKTYREADKKVKKILNIKDDVMDFEDDFTDLLIDDEMPKKPETKKTTKKAAKGEN